MTSMASPQQQKSDIMVYNAIEHYPAMHDILFELDIISKEHSEEERKKICQMHFEMLPNSIVKEIEHWGISDTVVRDEIYVFFKK